MVNLSSAQTSWVGCSLSVRYIKYVEPGLQVRSGTWTDPHTRSRTTLRHFHHFLYLDQGVQERPQHAGSSIQPAPHSRSRAVHQVQLYTSGPAMDQPQPHRLWGHIIQPIQSKDLVQGVIAVLIGTRELLQFIMPPLPRQQISWPMGSSIVCMAQLCGLDLACRPYFEYLCYRIMKLMRHTQDYLGYLCASLRLLCSTFARVLCTGSTSALN